MKKIAIVLRAGKVEAVYADGQPYEFDVEVLDLDGNGDPDSAVYAQERQQTVEQHLCKYYQDDTIPVSGSTRDGQTEKCETRCSHLACCQEEWDDSLSGYCAFAGGRNYIGLMDNISSGQCDCIYPEKKLVGNF